MLPHEIFRNIDALKSLLRPFWDSSRAIVATWLAAILHPIFGCPYMHLLSQMTLNFDERRYLGWQNSKWGDVTRRTTLERQN